jgi:hypothetical protein
MAADSVLEVWIGPVHLDVPRTVGYYGGVAIAVGAGLVEPPLGLLIAAVPFLKLLTHYALPAAVRFVGEVMEGASKPVGGDDEAVFHLHDERKTQEEAVAVALKVARGHRVQSAQTPRPATELNVVGPGN